MKPSKCRNKGCSNTFVKRSMSHVACGPACAETLAVEKREKAARIAAKVERQRDKEKLLEYRTIPQLKKAAEKSFNAFIRWRDRNETCISCGRPWSLLSYATGGSRGGTYDAGHYRSVGSADHLRFDEDNVHGQCKKCNGPNGQGRHVDYRIGLIHRKGIDVVERLENDNTVVKWTREMLLEIEQRYRAKTNELRKNQP